MLVEEGLKFVVFAERIFAATGFYDVLGLDCVVMVTAHAMLSNEFIVRGIWGIDVGAVGV